MGCIFKNLIRYLYTCFSQCFDICLKFLYKGILCAITEISRRKVSCLELFSAMESSP